MRLRRCKQLHRNTQCTGTWEQSLHCCQGPSLQLAGRLSLLLAHQESIQDPADYKAVSMPGCSASFLLLGSVNLWASASSREADLNPSFVNCILLHDLSLTSHLFVGLVLTVLN